MFCSFACITSSATSSQKVGHGPSLSDWSRSLRNQWSKEPFHCHKNLVIALQMHVKKHPRSIWVANGSSSSFHWSLSTPRISQQTLHSFEMLRTLCGQDWSWLKQSVSNAQFDYTVGTQLNEATFANIWEILISHCLGFQVTNRFLWPASPVPKFRWTYKSLGWAHLNYQNLNTKLEMHVKCTNIHKPSQIIEHVQLSLMTVAKPQFQRLAECPRSNSPLSLPRKLPRTAKKSIQSI